jgi:hypothetical protein
LTDNQNASQKKDGDAIAADRLFDDRVERAIDASRYRVREALKIVESTTKISFQGHIDYHKYLMEEARRIGDIATAMRHQVLMETYQSILKNFSLSNSYDRE